MANYDSMTDSQLRDRIDAHRVALEQMEGVLAVRSAMPEDRRLAADLHRLNCTDSGCSWSYESTWEGAEHQRFLAKAKDLLQLADASTAIRIAEISRTAR